MKYFSNFHKRAISGSEGKYLGKRKLLVLEKNMVLWYTSEVSVGEMKKHILLEGSFLCNFLEMVHKW